MFRVTKYLQSATCLGCEKPDRECVVIETEAYSGPHCSKCLMREAKKRKPQPSEGSPLFDRQPAHA